METNKIHVKKGTVTKKSFLSRPRKPDRSSKVNVVKEVDFKSGDDFRSKLRSKPDASKKEHKSSLNGEVPITCKRKREGSEARKRKSASLEAVSLESIDTQPQVPTKKRRLCASNCDSQSKDLGGKKERENGNSNLQKKTRGADGYFFECVVCDVGGNLLCCDKCPCTYHLECLDPPLKRTPPGKWQCPACRDQIPSPKIPTRIPSNIKKARSSRHSEERQPASSNQKESLKHNEEGEGHEKPIPAPQTYKKRKERSRKKESKTEKVGEPNVEKIEDAPLSCSHSEVDQQRSDLAVKDLNACNQVCKEESIEPGSQCKEPEEFVTPDKHFQSVKQSPVHVRESPVHVKVEEEDDNAHLKHGSSVAMEVDRIFGCRIAEPLDTVENLTAAKEGSGCDSQHRLNATTEVDISPVSQGSIIESGGDHESGLEHEKVSILKCEENQQPGSMVKSLERDNEGSSASCMDTVGTKLVNKSDAMSVSDLKQRPEDGSSVGSELKDKNLNDLFTDKQLSEELEYLVKWVGRSHIHNEWVKESKLKMLSKRKLDNYKFKHGTFPVVLVDEKWTQPQRILARRNGYRGVPEVLVKWYGLPYDECTWEDLEEPVIKKCPQLLERFELFEAAAKKIDREDSDDLNAKPGEIRVLVEQPKELNGGSLFPHQMEALNWLRKCWGRNKNVILADEMGLGKTISASAFISSLYRELNVKRPCLVLVPLSTMPNWMAEFSAWIPHVNVVEYHGSAKARATIRQHEWHAANSSSSKKNPKNFKFNVLLTTYEMVIADASQLRTVPWEVLIVDEGHRLKNTGSKLFQLLNTFTFSHRVLLTGTPLQNNVGEMYNLLSFLQPDAFPSLIAFEEKFNSLSTAEQIEELKRMVAPHMLRRLKKDTMQNIPPKTERLVPVELTSVQAEYYRALLTRNYQVLRQAGKAAQHKSLVNIVVQLRKVCNHPYLIPGTEPETGSAEFLHEMRIKASAKLTLLHAMLKSLKNQGHRVLIFSQMTKLLDILEDYLTVEYGNQTFERVDGSRSVAQRQAAIARFNQDTSRFVFLLSTRACGLGINLATADTVIIYDSDFNPHADIQAMNRAHRIGQSKRLLVYRLVVRASVEERILQLAKKKLMLDHLFANKSGSQKDVEDILKWGTEELFQDGSVQVDGVPHLPSSDIVMDGSDVADCKQRKRSGGLGDVYEDVCHKAGRPKVIWDDAAVARLLDRSDLGSEAPEGEGESDMLGSLKAWDWNEQDNADEEEAMEKKPGSPGNVNTGSAQEAEEESNWDKILKRRWEKLQNEEEGALGRGKRMRKAVSYKENIDAIAAEVLFESEEEEDAEPEYTPAGRALKNKLLRLRARQKERIAARCNKEAVGMFEMPRGPLAESELAREHHVGGLHTFPGFKLLPFQIPGIQIPGRDFDYNGLKLPANNATLLDNKMSQQYNSLSSRTGVISAPKFLSMEEINFSLPRSQLNQSACLDNETSTPLSFQGVKVNGTPLQNQLADKDAKHTRLHNSTVEDQFVGDSVEALRAAERNVESHQPPCEMSVGAVASFGNLQKHTNSLNLTMTLGLGESNETFEPLSTMRSLANAGNSKQSHNVAPVFFSQVPVPESVSTSSSRCTNKSESSNACGMNTLGKSSVCLIDDTEVKSHQNLPFFGGMARGKTPVVDNANSWTDNELDALWSGVRRHGRGNWIAMLCDPKLCFSKSRTAKDLADRWRDEQLKILGGPFDLPETIMSGEVSRSLFSSMGAGFPEPLTQMESLFGPQILKGGLNPAMPGVQSLMNNLENFHSQGPPDERRSSLPMWPQVGVEPRTRLPQHLGIGSYVGAAALKEGENSRLDLRHNIKLPRFSAMSSAGAPKSLGEDIFNNLGLTEKLGVHSQSNLPSPQFFLNKSIPDPFGTLRSTQVDAEWKLSNLQFRYGKGATSTYMDPVELRKLQNSSDKLPLKLQELQPCSKKSNVHSNLTMKTSEFSRAGLPLSGSCQSVNVPGVSDNRKARSFQCASHSSSLADECSSKPSCSSNLPHWLREAFKPPVSLEPVLPSTIAALSQAMDLVYMDCKPVLPVWVNPSPLPVLPQRQLKRKKGSAFGRRLIKDSSTASKEQPVPSFVRKLNQLKFPFSIDPKFLDSNFEALETRHAHANPPSCPSIPWSIDRAVDLCENTGTALTSGLSKPFTSLVNWALTASTSDNLEAAKMKVKASLFSLHECTNPGNEPLQAPKALDQGSVQQHWPMLTSGMDSFHSQPQGISVLPTGVSQEGVLKPCGTANLTGQGTSLQAAGAEDSPSKTQSADPCIPISGQHKSSVDNVPLEQTIPDGCTRNGL